MHPQDSFRDNQVEIFPVRLDDGLSQTYARDAGRYH